MLFERVHCCRVVYQVMGFGRREVAFFKSRLDPGDAGGGREKSNEIQDAERERETSCRFPFKCLLLSFVVGYYGSRV